jgi:hypothetical protein
MIEKKLSQASKLYDLLLDGNAHSTNEIQEKVYGREHLGYANIHARITDIRKKYGVRIINFKDDKIKSLTYYQLLPPEIPLEEMPEFDKWNQQGKLI